ncbi:MAG: IS66 family transposase [Gammaproteobacteria bacterium]
MSLVKSVAKPIKNLSIPLADEVIELREIVEKNEAELHKKDQQIEQLLDAIQLLRQKRFGRSADQVSKDQINLFDEAELETLLEDLEEKVTLADAPVSQPPTEKKKPVRRPLPEKLKRVEKIIDLSDEEKQQMGKNWVLIGYDSSEQLAVIPRQHYVIVNKRAKYAPINDEVVGAEQGIKIAPRAAQIIPKSIGHSSVIADVVTAKFVDGLPFYRQEKIYARDGIDLSRQTMSGWMIQLQEKLSPLLQLMRQILYQGDVLHIDETRLQVLNEPDRENTQQSYMWVYKGGPVDKPVILYQYADSRRAQVPVDFLYPEPGTQADHSLTLMSDGYSGYNALSRHAGIKRHAVCWAHARRKFVEASQGRKNTAAAHQMVALIGKLYSIERSLKDQTVEERKRVRQEKAKPILDKMKVWLDSKTGKVLPKSLLGKAIHYTLGLWPQLTVYLEEGSIPIDNNPAENAIRPFVIGRKNWLFSGSPRGAHASAILYSLIETAKANNLEPNAYLNYLFEQLPRAKSEQALIKLLPQHLKTSDLDR